MLTYLPARASAAPGRPIGTIAVLGVRQIAGIGQLRHSFTLNGKPIPLEIFRDLGDGDLADSGSIWVTVDVKAAIGSNLRFDDIKRNGLLARSGPKANSADRPK